MKFELQLRDAFGQVIARTDFVMKGHELPMDITYDPETGQGAKAIFDPLANGHPNAQAYAVIVQRKK